MNMQKIRSQVQLRPQTATYKVTETKGVHKKMTKQKKGSFDI